MKEFSSCQETKSASNSEMLLTPLEAAKYLGITPELLFFYTSKSFQKRPGENRRLETCTVNGGTRFVHAELDEFDQYLHQPWADPSEKRRDPPLKILAYLHAESGGACIRCGSGVGIETAHIEAWAVSRSNHHHNLLRICSACHSEHDLHQSLPTEELRRLKAMSIARLRGQLSLRMNGTVSCPAPNPDLQFFGRGIELAQLRESLRTDRFVLVRGPGGVGKTQLALQALATAETGRSVLWIEVERYGSVEAVTTALEIAIGDQLATRAGGDLAYQLDAMQACLVLDGIEQLRGPALDAMDDWISALQTKLQCTQVLVTSQVDLQVARFDHEVYLNGLDDTASVDLLTQFVRPGISFDSQSRESFVVFADGHPLTLRLAAMLVNFYGSGRTAFIQIERRGIELLEVQKRTALNRRTSLRICLSLAYEALSPYEQRLLFLIANAPGGMFSTYIEHWLPEIDDGRAAIAGLRRWSLVRIENLGEQAERLYMLSPIANYVSARWKTDLPSEASLLTKELAREFVMMVAAISHRSQDPAEISYMLDRFELELPNILRVLDFAENEPNDEELSLFTRAICSALMRYFFVLRLGDTGSRVMLRGARIAIRDGKLKRAIDLLAQMVGLASRSEDSTNLDAAMSILDEIECEAADAETRGNIALARAMFFRVSGNHSSTESFARVAIANLEAALSEYRNQSRTCSENPETTDLDEVENDLASSLGLLGDALLATGFYKDASAAYRKSLSWLRGTSIAVNDGQLQHQIGNCESHLGQHKVAAHCYMLAAQRFHSVGMREYLSNALGELGHTILFLSASGEPPILPSSKIVDAGLVDVAEDLMRCYSTLPLDVSSCAGVVRKLFGIIVLASLNKQGVGLEVFATQLKSNLLEPAAAALDAANEGWWDELGEDALHELESALTLAGSIACFERRAQENGISNSAVGELAAVCYRQGLWAGIRRLSFEWLAIYLCRRWVLDVGAGNDLEAAAERAAAGGEFILPMRAKPNPS